MVTYVGCEISIVNRRCQHSRYEVWIVISKASNAEFLYPLPKHLLSKLREIWLILSKSLSKLYSLNNHSNNLSSILKPKWD